MAKWQIDEMVGWPNGNLPQRPNIEICSTLNGFLEVNSSFVVSCLNAKSLIVFFLHLIHRYLNI
jgi:hypothetical protein